METVIIGAGGAGISALETIRRCDKDIPLTVISAERTVPYSLCALPSLLGGELPHKALPRVSKNFFKKNSVKVLQGSPVQRILADKQKLILKNGKSVKYQKLLIAAGSMPIIPPIEGIDSPGVFSLSTLAGCRAINDYTKKHKVRRAVIIGAGFTGIETALSLHERGIKTVIVEMLPRVLARILDEDMTEPVEQILNGKGIEIKLGEEVIQVTGGKAVNGIRLKSGGLIAGDLVVVSIGVRPNIKFLEGSGIKTNRGIIVNNNMRTNIENVYAAGDAAEAHDFILGKPALSAIWPNAVEQGRIAALNMMDILTVYEGNVSVNALNIDGISVTGMGQTANEAQQQGASGLEEIRYRNQHSRRKLILRDNRIIGFQSFGVFRNSGTIWNYMQKRQDISALKNELLKDSLKLQYNTKGI
ncbi:MAG: FAD-dependent oxidoreductase [Candidatus Brocadiia bacterium]